jgi:hypothetical protein
MTFCDVASEATAEVSCAADVYRHTIFEKHVNASFPFLAGYSLVAEEW